MAERVIRITAGTVTAEARLNDCATARAIWAALPIEAKAQTWGDEIYFPTDVRAAEDSARELMTQLPASIHVTLRGPAHVIDRLVQSGIPPLTVTSEFRWPKSVSGTSLPVSGTSSMAANFTGWLL